jgi:hypothetical protein
MRTSLATPLRCKREVFGTRLHLCETPSYIEVTSYLDIRRV